MASTRFTPFTQFIPFKTGFFFLAVALISLPGCASLFSSDPDLIDRLSDNEASDAGRGPARLGAQPYQKTQADPEPPSDQDEYVPQSDDYGGWTNDLKQIQLGMEPRQVLERWGQPFEVESAGDRRLGNQRWVYSTPTARKWGTQGSRMVYFENGRVAGWINP